jgi:hypothetical protein
VPPEQELHPVPGPKPKLIQHGWDVNYAADIAKHAARIDALPFDGLTVRVAHEPFSSKPVSLQEAQNDLAAMPVLTNVKHNFLIFRMQDGSNSNRLPYNLFSDPIWATIADNMANYASAAAATGLFDGIVIDNEYYGTSPVYQWDFGATTTPWTYSAKAGVTPGHQAADAQAIAQARGKYVMDAIRAAWPTVTVMMLHSPSTSEPASYAYLRGNDVAWANELMGPWFVGFVESAMGTPATVIDGGESYWQRSPSDFQAAYNWLKAGFANHGGHIVPSGAVTAAAYNATIKVNIGVFDRDVASDYATLSAATVQELLTYGLRFADGYEWFYSEAFDWRGTGWPKTPVPQEYMDAVAAAKEAA